MRLGPVRFNVFDTVVASLRQDSNDVVVVVDVDIDVQVLPHLKLSTFYSLMFLLLLLPVTHKRASL